MKVYLSSTLNDLENERKAIKEVLSGDCIVRESYTATESDLVESCLEDVSACEIYLGVIGLRYGFVPKGETKSITHLEYQRAKDRGLRRIVFIKDEKAIGFTDTDAASGEHPMAHVRDFRTQLTSGASDETRPGMFKTTDELKLAVHKAISQIRMEKTGKRTIFSGDQLSHPWAISYEVAIGYVPGTDEGLKDTLAAVAQSDRRITFFPLSPGHPKEYLSTLDTHARTARCVVVMITAASASRVSDAAADIAASITLVRQRSAGVFGLLVDLKPEALPPSLLGALSDVFQTESQHWNDGRRNTTFETFQLWRRARAPETPVGFRIAVPYLILALNEGEAQTMHDDPGTLFTAFGDSAVVRRPEFDALRTRLEELSPGWPQGFYGASRQQWQPFGPGMQTMNEFVLTAARRVNQAPGGSRERRLLRNAQLSLIPYAFEEFLKDQSGSRENLKRVCELGCLVLLDEFTLLHPKLRGSVDTLLASNNVAVVSITACDPTLRPLSALLGDLSYLKVGNLLSRFSHFEDLRCELALNSAERLQRWLRLVLPELVSTLGREQSDPGLLGNRLDELLAV